MAGGGGLDKGWLKIEILVRDMMAGGHIKSPGLFTFWKAEYLPEIDAGDVEVTNDQDKVKLRSVKVWKTQVQQNELKGGHFKWGGGSRGSKWEDWLVVIINSFLSELITMWALRWRWSVQVLVRTTGWSQITKKETLCLLWGPDAHCTALFDQSYLSRVTKMQNPAYADTYPGAVYTAEEVEIVFSPRLLFW